MGTGFQSMSDDDYNNATSRHGSGYSGGMMQPGQGGQMIPGQQQSGNMVDNHNQTFWGGAQTPGSMQASQATAAQSSGVNGMDPTAGRYNSGLAAQLWAQANGRGPSLAQEQQQRATEDNVRSQMAMAGASRNAGVGQYNAGQNAAASNQQAAGQSAQDRLAEQYQSQAALAGLTGQMQNAYGQNAQMGQQNNQFNAGAQNANNQFNAGAQNNQNQFYNQMMQQQQGQYNQYQQQHDLNEQQSNNEARNGLLSKGEDFLSGAASALSDEDQKTGVKSGAPATQSFFDRLQLQGPGSGSAGGQPQAAGQGNTNQDGRSFSQNIQKRFGQPGAAVAGNGSPIDGSMTGGGPRPAMNSMTAGASMPVGAYGGDAMMAMSDERSKQGVTAGSKPVDSFLGKLRAHEYSYKHPDAPGAAAGRHVSPMAQELEKAGPVGQSMVDDTPGGKVVNYGRGFGMMLAAQADHHQRLKQLEARVHG